MNLLRRIQSFANALAEHPVSFVAVGVFLGAWICTFFTSHGTFDPGLGIGNLIVNGISLVLLLCACSLSAHAAHAGDETNDSEHIVKHKLDAITASLLTLHEKVDPIRPMRRKANNNVRTREELPMPGPLRAQCDPIIFRLNDKPESETFNSLTRACRAFYAEHSFPADEVRANAETMRIVKHWSQTRILRTQPVDVDAKFDLTTFNYGTGDMRFVVDSSLADGYVVMTLGYSVRTDMLDNG